MSDHNAPTSAETGADPLLGRRIGDKYRIESLLARGGMGRVYKGVQEPLDRLVAVKILSPIETNNAANPQHEKRFLREASCTARLSHPNTVVIHDYGTIPDSHHFYLVMEYLDGLTLRQLLAQNGPLSASRAVHIAIQIAQSLQEAHEAGVVHRDLKPPNIMLVHRGNDPDFVKVLDFGLVKSIAEDTDEDLTLHGTLVGSPAYMSPEQVLNLETDARSDIYSLGILLYEMLVGRPPFKRSGTSSSMGELVKAQVQTAPPPLKTYRPDIDVPSELENIILRCLHKDPTKRYQSMNELVTILYSLPLFSGDITAVGRRMTGMMPVVTADLVESVKDNPPAPVPTEAPNTETGADFRPQATVPKWVWPLLLVAVLVGVGGVYALFGTTNDGPGPSVAPSQIPSAVPVTTSSEQPKVTADPHIPTATPTTTASPELPPTTVANTNEAPTDPPKLPTEVAETNTTPTVAGTTAPTMPPQVTLSFVSTPPGAEVSDGDVVLGTTPFEKVLPRQEFTESRSFRFRRLGFIDETVMQPVPNQSTVQIEAKLREQPKVLTTANPKSPKQKKPDTTQTGKPPKTTLEIKGDR